MTVSIEVEDEAWNRLQGLEGLVQTAVGATLAALGEKATQSETVLLFTDDDTICGINAEWRGKNIPTNVLSFPVADAMPLPEGETRQLGDIVLAYGVVAREAREQGKTLHDHTAHLIVHGVLHLLGHDHADDEEAAKMERLEIGILKGLGISNPYE